MIVLGRLDSGTWVRWKVGRRCLAWQPSRWELQLLPFAEEPFTLFVLVPVLALLLLTSIALLLASMVMWPVRAITGRWLVVACQLDGDEHEPRSAWVQGRAASDELIQQWRRDIEKHGHPVAQPGVGVRDGSL